MSTKLAGKLSVTAIAALSLAVAASPAAASVTVGQTGTPAACGSNFDRLQPSVTAGNTYVMPAAGTITSWSTQAIAGGGTLGMKVFRPLGGTRYMVVGHEGPHALTGDAANTFPASVAVKAGDVLGSNTPLNANDPGCVFAAPGETFLGRAGDLPDGANGEFTPAVAFRLNISAVLNPTNTFTLGKPKLNKKGTATLAVRLPNPGELTGSGKGVRVAGKTVSAPGAVKLAIKALGKKKRKLAETGKVKVKPKITYTPTGGDPRTQPITVMLKKKLSPRKRKGGGGG
jgi:hypothetical protein